MLRISPKILLASRPEHYQGTKMPHASCTRHQLFEKPLVLYNIVIFIEHVINLNIYQSRTFNIFASPFSRCNSIQPSYFEASTTFVRIHLGARQMCFMVGNVKVLWDPCVSMGVGSWETCGRAWYGEGWLFSCWDSLTVIFVCQKVSVGHVGTYHWK